jgi:ATP-binding cassette subfamily F protein 3
VQELSGGEQRRLALAKLVLSNANVLFLDEPTNHLDLPSLDALEEALNSYEGTLLVITHDRFFAQRVGERIFVLEDGKLLEFADYTQYETWREARQQQIAEEYRSERKTEYQQQKRERRGRPSPETRRLQRELAECEAELTVLEEEKNRLLQELSRPEVFNDFATAQEYGRQLQEVEQHLEEAYNKWAALAEKVEAILAANVSENA